MRSADNLEGALLVHRAVGDRLTCVFVDHGLMRMNEGDQVIAAFRDHFKVLLVAVDAEDRFLDRVQGVSEPEAKRKAIGAEFIRVFEEEAATIGDAAISCRARCTSDLVRRQSAVVHAHLVDRLLKNSGPKAASRWSGWVLLAETAT